MYSDRLTLANRNCGLSASSQMQIKVPPKGGEISSICEFPFVLLIKFIGKYSFAFQIRNCA